MPSHAQAIIEPDFVMARHEQSLFQCRAEKKVQCDFLTWRTLRNVQPLVPERLKRRVRHSAKELGAKFVASHDAAFGVPDAELPWSIARDADR